MNLDIRIYLYINIRLMWAFGYMSAILNFILSRYLQIMHVIVILSYY